MDPQEMKPLIEQQLQRLRNPNEQFRLDELHALDFSEAADPKKPTFGKGLNEDRANKAQIGPS